MANRCIFWEIPEGQRQIYIYHIICTLSHSIICREYRSKVFCIYFGITTSFKSLQRIRTKCWVFFALLQAIPDHSTLTVNCINVTKRIFLSCHICSHCGDKATGSHFKREVTLATVTIEDAREISRVQLYANV